MPFETINEIKAKYHIPAEVKEFNFGRTTIIWDNQKVIIKYMGDKSYSHDITQTEWDNLEKVFKPIFQGMPDVTDVVWPSFKDGAQ